MQMEDAVNEGVVAIIKGIDMYDPDKNIKFSTYITTRVRGAMLDYVRKQEWMPRGFYKQLGIIESACEDMKLELGRTPTDVYKRQVDSMSATRSYEANVTALNAIKLMAQKALEIGK